MFDLPVFRRSLLKSVLVQQALTANNIAHTPAGLAHAILVTAPPDFVAAWDRHCAENSPMDRPRPTGDELEDKLRDSMYRL